MKEWTLSLAVSTDNPEELVGMLEAIKELAIHAKVKLKMPKDTYRKLGAVKHMIEADPEHLMIGPLPDERPAEGSLGGTGEQGAEP